jgi:hypothetical protein
MPDSAKRGARAYTPAENLVFRRIGDEGVLVPTTGQAAIEGKLFAVNELGVLIWDLLVKGVDRVEMVRTITDAYEIDEAHAASDLDQFLEELAAAGCLDTPKACP